MWKELRNGKETVKVSSQSMPNLTNLFRIGREAVKSNVVVDDVRCKAAFVKTPACMTLSVNIKNLL